MKLDTDEDKHSSPGVQTVLIFQNWVKQKRRRRREEERKREKKRKENLDGCIVPNQRLKSKPFETNCVNIRYAG